MRRCQLHLCWVCGLSNFVFSQSYSFKSFLKTSYISNRQWAACQFMARVEQDEKLSFTFTLSFTAIHFFPGKKGPTVAQWKETLTGLCCEYTVTVCFSVCLIIFYKAHASVCISPTLGTTNLPPCKKCFSSNLFILRRVEQRYQPG